MFIFAVEKKKTFVVFWRPSQGHKKMPIAGHLREDGPPRLAVLQGVAVESDDDEGAIRLSYTLNLHLMQLPGTFLKKTKCLGQVMHVRVYAHVGDWASSCRCKAASGPVSNVCSRCSGPVSYSQLTSATNLRLLDPCGGGRLQQIKATTTQ